MKENQHFSIRIVVKNSQEEVFRAVNNVRGWWSENIEGSTDALNQTFLYQYKDVHICKIKVVELIPEKKVVWKVTENHFNFAKDKREWVDNEISFEISGHENGTELVFTQAGLIPEYECYEICKEAWGNYIQHSLKKLIETGKGEPNPKEGRLGFVAAILPNIPTMNTSLRRQEPSLRVQRS